MAKYKLKNLLKEFHAGKSIASDLIRDAGEYPVFGGNGQRGYTDTYNQGGQYLIIGRQGAYCGNVRYNIGKAFLTEHAIVGQANEENNAIYLALKLSLMDLGKLQGQSAQPGLSVETLSCISLDIPSKEIQDEIAKIIVTLDKKIALNRQINDNLEAMAKQLYDYWFVQFDFPNEEGKPYKTSGGEMVWNEKLKREIPACFEVMQLGDLCHFRNGINYAKDEVGERYEIVNVRNISSSKILLDGEFFDTITVSQSKANNYILNNEDIIIARSGCPGATRLLLSSTNTLFCGFIICCSPYKKELRNYLTYCLKQLEGTNATTSGGSILQNVSQDTLKGLNIIKPPLNIIGKFNDSINLIFARMLNCLKEINNLTKQRDELLPLLMNGQATVNYHLSDD